MDVEFEKALSVLTAGGVLGVPTDTVYGLSVLKKYEDELYKIKKRDKRKKIVTLIWHTDQIGELDDFTREEIKQLTLQYWPGNTTLILRQQGEWISYRIPNEPNLLRFLKKYDLKLMTSSANISGSSPILTREEFNKKFSRISLLKEDEQVVKTLVPSKIWKISKNKKIRIR